MKLEDVQKKIKELAQLRGRKGVDKHDMFRQFEALLRVSEKFGAVEPLTILTLFISAEFDQTTGAFQVIVSSFALSEISFVGNSAATR